MKLGLTMQEAAQAVGSRALVREMERAGWIKPVLRRHRLTLFDSDALCRAWDRIKKGEKPSSPASDISQLPKAWKPKS